MSHSVTKADLQGLWSLLWRVALFGTVLLPVAVAFFILVMVLVAAPPLWALVCFMEGHFMVGIGVLLVWLLALRLGRRFLGSFNEGWEYAGI